MYGRRGFTVPLYSCVDLTCAPIPMTNHLASGDLLRKCEDNITVSEFNSFTDEINNFDSGISPMLRNIKWFVETAEFRLVARDPAGKIKGKKY